MIATTPSAAPQISVQQKAQRSLYRYVKEDSANLNWSGQYIAILATKIDPIEDKRQTPSSNPKTHWFHWVDILAEHENFRHKSDFGSDVRIILSSQIGDGLLDKVSHRPLLMTIFDPTLNGSQNAPFAGPQAVLDWCRTTFPDLNADKLNNQCRPAKMTRAR